MQRMFLLSSLLALLCLTSCESENGEKEITAQLLVTSPILKDTTINADYVCQIRSIQHIEMRALERGYLQNIYVDEGQRVKKGQLMFRIMPTLYEAETQKAKAEADFAEIEYKTTKDLAERNIVSKNELSMAKAKYERAKAELALARVHLGFTEIRAPFDGFMDHFRVRPGSLVEEGDLLTTLSDNSQMWVYFNVPEAQYLDFKMHAETNGEAEVKLRMANDELFPFTGKVETIEADFNNETGNIAFRATFPNPKQLLRHGETGNILMAVPHKNVLILPQKASFEILEKRYVFIVGKDNVVHQREITVVSELPDLYVIKNDLPAKAKVLLEGIRKVKDGDKIRYKYVAPGKVLSNLAVYVE